MCHSARSSRAVAVAGEHRRRADEVTGQRHDVLAVLVAEQLADARLRSGLLAREARRHRAQADQLEHRVLDVDRGDALAHRRVGDRPGGRGPRR